MTHSINLSPRVADVMTSEDRDYRVHMHHCNQGEYDGGCKYGEDASCPAVNRPTEPVEYHQQRCPTHNEKGNPSKDKHMTVNVTPHVYSKLNITFRNLLTGDKLDVKFNIDQNAFAQKWATALDNDYLTPDNVILEKNFMLHGWPYKDTANSRSIAYMCKELDWHIDKINEYAKENNIDYYITERHHPDTVSGEYLNKIHHHFEILIGQIWNVSPWWKEFDEPRRFSIRQLNHFCHELESALLVKNAALHHRSVASVVTCMYPIVRHALTGSDYDNFKLENTKFGDIRMHYAQTGKSHLEAYVDGDTDIFTENITGIQYMSGEFDIVFNTDGNTADWDAFAKWIIEQGFDINDKTLSLGYATFGSLDRTQFEGMTDQQIVNKVVQYDDIYSIGLEGTIPNSKIWDYSWKDIYYEKMKDYYDET